LFGGEQTHKGIMETDGVTLARGGAEYVRAIAEIRRLEAQVVREAPEPEALRSRRAAVLWRQDNLWEMQASPHTKAWDTWSHVYAYYAALKAVGAAVTFVAAEEVVDPAVHPFLIVPACSMVDAALVDRWEAYAEAGGHLILSCRTGQKDDRGHFHESRLQAPIHGLIGAGVEDNDQLPPDVFGRVRTAGGEHRWSVWGELLSPKSGTEVLASYQDQYYAGTPAAVTRRLGRGTVTYVGVASEGGTLEREIVRRIYQDSGATILDLPSYVFVEWRSGVWVAVNYSSEAVDLPVSAGSEVLLGAPRLAPGEVTIWRDGP
jgi:beta-galactosidase